MDGWVVVGVAVGHGAGSWDSNSGITPGHAMSINGGSR